MTYKQFQKKAQVARKIGEVNLGSGLVLIYNALRNNRYWSLENRYECGHNVVATAYDPQKIAEIVCD